MNIEDLSLIVGKVVIHVRLELYKEMTILLSLTFKHA